MIVAALDFKGVAPAERKADAPSGIHGHRPLAASLSPQLVQADAFERTEILQRLGYIQCRQKFNGGLEIQSAELVWHLAVPHSAGGGIAPGPDHGKKIVRGSVSVECGRDGKVTRNSVRSFGSIVVAFK